jgi:hypothetical protein
VDVVFYVASLIEFDHFLYEDDRINRLNEDLEVLKETLQLDCLKNAKFYLLFTKEDLLKLKCKNHCLLSKDCDEEILEAFQSKLLTETFPILHEDVDNFTNFRSLDLDCLLNILKYLRDDELLNVNLTNHYMYKITTSDTLWRKKCFEKNKNLNEQKFNQFTKNSHLKVTGKWRNYYYNHFTHYGRVKSVITEKFLNLFQEDERLERYFHINSINRKEVLQVLKIVSKDLEKLSEEKEN